MLKVLLTKLDFSAKLLAAFDALLSVSFFTIPLKNVSRESNSVKGEAEEPSVKQDFKSFRKMSRMKEAMLEFSFFTISSVNRLKRDSSLKKPMSLLSISVNFFYSSLLND